MSGSDISPIGPMSTLPVELIENIFRRLEWQHLRNCRHVNLLWMSIATPLIRRNGPSLFFQYHYISRRYQDKEDRPLSDLTEIARTEMFPCTSFTFRGGDLRSNDAVVFFKVYGQFVQTLTLMAVDNADFTPKMHLSTILKRTPNLVTLILNRGSFYDYSFIVQLPKLKCIEIACRFDATLTQCINMLLNGAPDLERIDGVWRLEDLGPIVTLGKIDTIKSWCPTGYLTEERIISDPFPEGLIELAGPTFDALTLNELVVFVGESNFRRDGLVNVDANTLWACYGELLAKNSIQKLILKCSNYPVGYQLPLNMYNVKELVLMPNWNPRNLRHFPRNIALHATFPRLHTLSFYDPLYQTTDGRNWTRCFPLADEYENFDEIWPTVTILNLRDLAASIRMLRTMKKICPNVQNLEIFLNGILDQKLIVWELYGEWRHLKKLSIVLDECRCVSKYDLDRIFTGNKPTFLQHLTADQSLTEAGKLEKAENERYVLWIGNITGLIELDVQYKIPHRHRTWLTNDNIVPFSSFSGKYGFALMPNLKVRLHYLNCECCTDSAVLRYSLDSIRPFATIIRR